MTSDSELNESIESMSENSSNFSDASELEEDPLLILAEVLQNTLGDPSGETLTTVLADIRDQFKIHNKLLIKIMRILSKEQEEAHAEEAQAEEAEEAQEAQDEPN